MLRIFIWVVMLVGGSGLGLWLDWRWFHSWLVNPFFHLATLVIGGLLLSLVLRASRHTGRLLARMGREGEIPRLETNKLVVEEVYGCMRHPMHLGLLFFPWSVALILGSPSFILFNTPLASFSDIGTGLVFPPKKPVALSVPWTRCHVSSVNAICIIM